MLLGCHPRLHSRLHTGLNGSSHSLQICPGKYNHSLTFYPRTLQPHFLWSCLATSFLEKCKRVVHGCQEHLYPRSLWHSWTVGMWLLKPLNLSHILFREVNALSRNRSRQHSRSALEHQLDHCDAECCLAPRRTGQSYPSMPSLLAANQASEVLQL